MQTAREWCADRGLAELGKRGRLSQDAHKALEGAVSEGIKFSDYPKEKVVTTVKIGRRKHERVTFVNPDKEGEYDNAPRIWDKAFRIDGNKKTPISLANACMLCGYSIGWCNCHMRLDPTPPRVVNANGKGSSYVEVDVND